MKIKLILILILTTSILNAKLSSDEQERVESEKNGGVVCPKTKQYVCGKLNSKLQTFDNECVMGKEGGIKIYNGSCKIIPIVEPSKDEMENMNESTLKREDLYNTDVKKQTSELTKEDKIEIKRIEKERKLIKKEKRMRNHYRNKDLNELKNIINSEY